MTAKYSYDYENDGGMDYDQISAANPGTTAMTPVTRIQTIPTNYPVATREDNKVLFGVSIFLVSYGWGCGAFFVHFFMQILFGSYMGQYSERMFFYFTQIFCLVWFFFFFFFCTDFEQL